MDRVNLRGEGAVTLANFILGQWFSNFFYCMTPVSLTCQNVIPPPLFSRLPDSEDAFVCRKINIPTACVCQVVVPIPPHHPTPNRVIARLCGGGGGGDSPQVKNA